LFVQGNYQDHIANASEVIRLVAEDGALIAQSAAPIPGDYDASGVVDQNDYAVWRLTYGSRDSLAADGNLNGEVDTADFIIWRKAFGAAQAAGATAVAAALPPAASDVVNSPAESSPATTLRRPQLAAALPVSTSVQFPSRSAFRPSSKSAASPALHDLALIAVLDPIVAPRADDHDQSSVISSADKTDDSVEWIDDAFEAFTLM
jgi:hypothetical protein